MKVVKLAVIAAAIGMAYGGPLFAADAAKEQHKVERERIQTEAKAAREKCKDLKANAKDICMAEAKGQEQIAKAELALKQKDTAKNRYDVAAAKADAEYNVAKEKCDDMKGKDKDACQKDAKTARDSAKQQAKAEREAAEPRKEAKAKKTS